MKEVFENKDLFDGSFLFPEGDFEERTGRRQYLKKSLNFLKEKNLYDHERDCIRQEFSEYRNCPVCDERKKDVVFIKEGFKHVKCERCQFIYVDPILNNVAMNQFYREEDQWTKVMLNRQEQEINKRMYTYTLRVINRFDDKICDILDVGAGTGLFVEVANNSGLNAVGIDPNVTMVERAERKGLDLFNMTLNELKKSGRHFDLVTSWFVLEHVPAPKIFIREMMDLLKDKGLLFVAVPNIDCLAHRFFQVESSTFGGYSHINFFNIDSLNKLASDNGLILLHAETYITQLANIRKYFSKLGLTPSSGLNRFIDDLTSNYIHDNLLGSFLCCLYRKN